MAQGNPKSEEMIFKTAVQIQDRHQRQGYVLEACGGNPQLLQDIEALLHYHDAGSFLDAPAFDPEVCPEGAAMTEGPGTAIGRYKLLERIGEGGMAVVYMAEQERPIRRRVALKVIKLGMDTRQVIARFEAERQALAMMDHPCIAKVLDAGATETGRPYFVMELVQGVSITDYCDRNSLGTKDRLGLFLQVCHAVQHAHQKGIIHRDLKPSNVMVTHHDGQPVPKVIDFGIAKAINQKLTEKTLFTRYAHLIGTPAYMSPEQAELSDLDIDTRSDIYSLGVLLYELLTGTTPFSEEELRKAGYLEMQRIIREQEPVKPSARIQKARRSTGILPVSIRGILPLRGRQTRSVALGRPSRMGGPPLTSDHGQDARGTHGRDGRATDVRGDLDWIVMKTLEKDRTRRYDTASGLAEDIRRHLESKPVMARAPSAAYRLQKFLRRNRPRVLVALGMVALSIATAVLFRQWNQDRQRLDEAQNLRDQGILSQAGELYAKADRKAALDTLQSIPADSPVSPEARLLKAGILVDERRFEAAAAIADTLLNAQPEIAGTAHSLLARILWESESLDAEKLKRIEEHHRQAEALLPETAEAYFLRAMTAPTVKEQFAALDKALQLDPHHYEARRLRAFTCYASRQYDRLRDDALVMTVLRGQDPLGYSLRAAAGQELGRYADAMADYNSAMALMPKDSPPYLDWATQRCEALLRMGDHEPAAAAIRDCCERWPDTPVFQYYRFCAQTALGNYDKAADLFREIVSRTPTAREAFRSWVTEYVFRTLAAGQSWHPPDHEPTGAAFLPLVEAAETYRSLSAKGRRIIRDGFSAQWSPNGRKLAFSLGVLGRSGVAVYDADTKQTDLLIVPGKYPKWSPDGQYIAFVRDRQFLRVPEFMAAHPKSQPPAPTDEEVWIMKSDGTQPRRLARGVWPSWGRDSDCVYYHSRPDSTLYSISIVEEAAEPKQTLPCPGFNPSVSPDNQHVAYTEGTSLKVIDLISQKLVAQWPLPLPCNGWGASAWSPEGDELCLGGSGDLENATGLWIYRLNQREPAPTLGGPITIGSWSPDGTKLVFELGAPHYEIWTADLAPDVSAIETLGPPRTVQEHLRKLVALQTRRIHADPLDAYAYSSRARCHDCLHDRAAASADMRRWSAAASGRLPWDFRRIINLPFDGQLVFSAERPVNTMPTMSIAFGQKGRCEMGSLKMPVIMGSMVAYWLLSGFGTPRAHADFVFGEPTNLGALFNTSVHEYAPRLSPNGLELYFARGDEDMWVARRETPGSEWGPPTNLGPIVNIAGCDDGRPSLSSDGLALYFDSARPGGYGAYDLWMTTRATLNDNWGPPVNLGATVNTGDDWAPCISADGLELYFTSIRPGGYGIDDLWVTTRATVKGNWGPPVNLGATINTPGLDAWPSLSADGLLLFLVSNRPGGYGSMDLYVARRATKKDPWGPPVNLGPQVNSTTLEHGGMISADGSTLYFDSLRPGGAGGVDLWQAPVIRITDFNGDGKVDAADVNLLADNWGTDDTFCDIGPYAWGDGMVDEKDLAILMEALMIPSPKALGVPCDVVLNWVSPSIAQSSDVYLGTSFEAVHTATRDDPLDVLVRWGQSGTTYTPDEPLGFSQTYYWRIDTVLGPSNTSICKGPVLSFTTEPYARVIQNIIATASISQPGMGPQNTVDGSGLDQNDGHSTTGTDMWQSGNVAGPHWIQYEFDQVYTLHELRVWNSNQLVEPFLGFGVRSVKIEYSSDGATWTALDGVPEFAKAPGLPGYVADTIINFGGVSARYVKLTIEKGWGATPAVGLSEVRFFYIPERSATSP